MGACMGKQDVDDVIKQLIVLLHLVLPFFPEPKRPVSGANPCGALIGPKKTGLQLCHATQGSGFPWAQIHPHPLPHLRLGGLDMAVMRLERLIASIFIWMQMLRATILQTPRVICSHNISSLKSTSRDASNPPMHTATRPPKKAPASQWSWAIHKQYKHQRVAAMVMLRCSFPDTMGRATARARSTARGAQKSQPAKRISGPMMNQ